MVVYNTSIHYAGCHALLAHALRSHQLEHDGTTNLHSLTVEVMVRLVANLFP